MTRFRKLAGRTIRVALFSAGLILPATLSDVAAESLNLSGLDNASLLAVMEYNMDDLFEAQRRRHRTQEATRTTHHSDTCNLNIGTRDKETSDEYSIYDNEPAIIIDGPIIVTC